MIRRPAYAPLAVALVLAVQAVAVMVSAGWFA